MSYGGFPNGQTVKGGTGLYVLYNHIKCCCVPVHPLLHLNHTQPQTQTSTTSGPSRFELKKRKKGEWVELANMYKGKKTRWIE